MEGLEFKTIARSSDTGAGCVYWVSLLPGRTGGVVFLRGGGGVVHGLLGTAVRAVVLGMKYRGLVVSRIGLAMGVCGLHRCWV